MNITKREESDIVVKKKAIMVVALISLFGYILEMGPIGHAWQLTILGFGYTLPVLGFLPYLSLTMSAAIGLRVTEHEYRHKEDEEEEDMEINITSEGEAVREKVAVKPDLHQLRMIITALGGYAILRVISNFFLSSMYPTVYFNSLVNGFEFGFYYTAFSWLVLWQFMRWFTLLHKWRRLYQELVGSDINKFLAIVIGGTVLFSLYRCINEGFSFAVADILKILIIISLGGIAYLIWHSRPFNLSKTLINSGWIVLLITVLTIFLVPAERYLIR